MSGISCRSLVKRYGELEVVHGFTLDVQDHEFIVFLGPSGCGKSTILRMLAGLESITAGELIIGGKDVTNLDPGDRGIAMVFQNYALYPHMTIKDNIAFGLRRLRVSASEIERRVEAVVTMLGLQPVINRKPTELSGGQQQRVAIARAMIKTPDVFLFDEPLSNLDAKLRNQMRHEIAKLHKSLRATTVYVTHDQLEAMSLADRIVLMTAGRIEQVGTPEELYLRPQTLFTASFVGTPAMNFLSMAVEVDGGTSRLVGSDLTMEIDDRVFDLSGVDSAQVGIRPSDLHRTKDDSGENVLKGICELVEFHGDHVLVTFSSGGTSLNALVPIRDRPTENEAVVFSLSAADIHIFDTRSGKTLRRPTAL